MSAYLLRPRARADLEEIWDYTADRWGEAQAERYVRVIGAAFDRIARDPRSGQSCAEIRPGYAKLSVGAHVVFFRRTGRGVEIVRILHSRMDFGRHL